LVADSQREKAKMESIVSGFLAFWCEGLVRWAIVVSGRRSAHNAQCFFAVADAHECRLYRIGVSLLVCASAATSIRHPACPPETHAG